MATVSSTFTADGVSSEIKTGAVPEDIAYSVTGPFDGLVDLQRSVTPDGSAWESIAGPWDSPSASKTGTLRVKPNDRIRFRLRDGTVAVSNGDFAAADDWVVAAPWSITGGEAVRTASASEPTMTQTISSGLVAGASYSLTFTMTRTAGTLTPSVGGTAGTGRSASDTYTETIVAGSTDDLVFTAGATFAGTVDDVELTPVITYSFSDSDARIGEVRDAHGNVIRYDTQSGTTIPGDLTVSGTTTLAGAAITLSGAISSPAIPLAVSTSITAAAHDGRTIVMGGAGSARTFTLPAATGSGARFRFVVGAVNTSNYIIAPTGNDLMDGTIIGNSTGDAAASAVLAWLAGATDNTITLNGTTKGGVAIGDFVELEDIAADQWAVRGVVTQSGVEATPFSTV